MIVTKIRIKEAKEAKQNPKKPELQILNSLNSGRTVPMEFWKLMDGYGFIRSRRTYLPGDERCVLYHHRRSAASA